MHASSTPMLKNRITLRSGLIEFGYNEQLSLH